MKDLDAFYHRVICLKSLCPIRCPVCDEICDELLSCKSTGWEAHTMIWHLHACQNDCHASLEAQRDWGSFISRYAGRSEVAQRLFYALIGERISWGTRKHRDSVKAKKNKGLARQDGIYRTKSSPLRVSQKIVPARRLNEGSEIEVTRVAKEVVADKIPLDRFKRSSYSVMKLPRSANMRTDYESGGIKTEFLPLSDPMALWSHFNHKAKTPLPPKPAPVASSFAAAPPATETTVPSAAAEDFPLISDTDKVPSRSQSPKCLKYVAELDSNQNMPLDLPKKPKTDSKPVAAKAIVVVPRIFDKHPAIKSPSPRREADSPILPSPSLARKSRPIISSTSGSHARPHKERYAPAPFGSNRTESRNGSTVSASLSPAGIPTASPAVVSMPIRCRPARPSASMLRLGMFLNPDELGQEIAVETYTYGSRGAVPVGLRSVIKMIVDPALSTKGKMACNRECCDGMFGYVAETRDGV